MEKRLRYPEHEEKHSWLGPLLDSYNESDRLTANYLKGIQREGVVIACGARCAVCCAKPTVLVTEPEMAGISWFVAEVLTNPMRELVKHRLDQHDTMPECSFLVDENCAIYPMRPTICRQFYVRGRRCLPGENVRHTRREDIVLPPKAIARATALHQLKYWGITTTVGRKKAFNAGVMINGSHPLNEYDLQQLAEIMGLFAQQS